MKKLSPREFKQAMYDNVIEERKAMQDIMERSMKIDKEYKRGAWAPEHLKSTTNPGTTIELNPSDFKE